MGQGGERSEACLSGFFLVSFHLGDENVPFLWVKSHKRVFRPASGEKGEGNIKETFLLYFLKLLQLKILTVPYLGVVHPEPHQLLLSQRLLLVYSIHSQVTNCSLATKTSQPVPTSETKVCLSAKPFVLDLLQHYVNLTRIKNSLYPKPTLLRCI